MSINQVGDVLRGSVNGKGDATSFDLPNIGDLNDIEIEDYVTLKLGNLDSPDTYKKVNRILSKVLIYLKEELFFTDKELARFKRRKEIKNRHDIVSFLQETKRKNGRMNCVIIKLFQAFHDSDEEFNERVKEVKDKTQGVIDGKLLKPLRVFQSNNDEYSGEELFEFQPGKYRKIKYKLKKRLKSLHSRVSKEIRDPKYSTMENISDLHGLTFEVEQKEDILPLMQMVAGYTFKHGEFLIKNDKGLFNKEEILENNEIRDDFKTKILTGTVERDKPESGDISDIKLMTSPNKGEKLKNMNIEIKFSISKNQNEKGLNMHGIYGYFKKINERIRLEGFVSHGYLELISKKLIENLDMILVDNVGRPEQEGDSSYEYKKELFNDLKSKNIISPGFNQPSEKFDLRNSHIKSNIDNYLYKGVLSYFKSRLTPVTVNSGAKTYYSNKRSIEMSEAGLGTKLSTLQA